MARDAAAPWAEEVLMTADELMALPDDARHYELVQGRLVRVPPTGLEHGDIQMGLAAALRHFVDEGGLGVVAGAETGFLLSSPGEPDTVLAPDIAFIAASRLPARNSRDWKGFPRLAPDLAVEIASPRQYRPEMEVKVRLWLDAGVRLLWVIWPAAQQVDVWRPHPAAEMSTLQGSDVLDGETVLPGFAHPINRLWR